MFAQSSLESPLADTFTPLNALVNRNSTPQQKIDLYTSLFIGRQDVFALRWYNAKSNKSGYSPVCENKWKIGKCDMKKYSCATCPFKLPVPLSDSYIFNHLAGKDAACRDVVGLYPLMEGDVCRFLAFDFDSHTESSDAWKKDTAAVRKTCEEFSIPVSVEISRSGKGAHLWIFFSEAVAAKHARNFGTLILQAAMNERHSLPFESFDRMFPNQDAIPKGGYGNLIALPLQGQAVKNKCSIFVDENFIPFEDQWAYLSSVRTLSEKAVQTRCTEIAKAVPDFLPNDFDADGINKPDNIMKSGTAYKIIKRLQRPYEITDEREQGMCIGVDFTAELYAEQQAALQAMLKSDIGILSAGTGFGKTVTAAALIAERKTNTMILVQTHTFLEQWKKAVKRFLNYEAGTIAAGKDTATGIIDIAIIKSLTEKNSDAVKPRRHTYGMLIVDECHHVSAFGTENLIKSFRAKYVYGLTATPIRRDGRPPITTYNRAKPISYVLRF